MRERRIAGVGCRGRMGLGLLLAGLPNIGAAQEAARPLSQDPAARPSVVRVRMEGDPATSSALAYVKNNDLYMRAADLVHLGLVRGLPGTMADGDSLVPLLRQPGLTVRSVQGSEAVLARQDAAPAAGLAEPATQRIRLWVNNEAAGEILAITFGGQRYFSRDELRRLGVSLPRGPQRAVSIPELRAFVVDLREGTDMLRVWTLPPEAEPAAPPMVRGPAPAGPEVVARVPARRAPANQFAAVTLQTSRRAIQSPVRSQPPLRDFPLLPTPAGQPPPPGGTGAVGAGANGPGTLAVLLVRINGGQSRFIVRVRRLEGRVLIRREDLAELRIRPPPGQGEVSLDDITGLRWRILEEEQVLELTVPEELLDAQALLLSERQRRPVDRAAFGSVLNYDIEAQQRIDGGTGPRTAGFGFLRLNSFSPYGSLTATALGRSGGADPRSDGDVVRLETTYQLDDVDRGWSYRLGDVLTGGAEGARRIRLGGVQWASDTLLRPDLLNFARPFISGSAAAPSTLDLIVNGVQTYSAPVGAGPFELRDIPVMLGANSVRVTLRDAQGITSTRVVDIFSSRRLLARGVTEHSLEAGAIRRTYGFRSFDYGVPAGSGFVRRGLTDSVTAIARAEGTAAGGVVGGGATILVNPLGTITVEPSVSFGQAGQGGEIAGRWEVSRQSFSLGVGASQAFGDYKDLAAQAGAPMRRSSVSVSGGVSLGEFGFLGATYLEQKLEGSPRQQILLGSLFRTVAQNVTLGVTGFADFAGRTSGAMAYLAMPLGGDVRGSLSGGTDRGGAVGRASVERPTPFAGGLGWRVATQEGVSPLRQADVRYASPATEVELGVQSLGTDTAARARVSGSVVALDGVHLRRNLPGSVASVDLGTPGVQVFHENRPVGVTDASGRLLVTGLQPFDANRISVNPLDLPMTTQIDSPTLVVVPPRDAGVRARFGTNSTLAVLLRLVREDGSVPSQNAEARDADGRSLGTVGLDGELYLTDVSERFPLLVIENGRRCRADVQIPAERRAVPTVVATCVAQ